MNNPARLEKVRQWIRENLVLSQTIRGVNWEDLRKKLREDRIYSPGTCPGDIKSGFLNRLEEVEHEFHR